MERIVFSGDYIDRAGELRAQPEAIDAALRDPRTRFLPIWRGKCLIASTRDSRVGLLPRGDVEAHLDDPERLTLLGTAADGRAIFGVAIEPDRAPAFGPDWEFVGLREISSRLPDADAGLVAYAKAMVAWQDRHRHCGMCGAPNRLGEAGFTMECSDARCGNRSFPRLDPAIIVLVRHEDSCLLGRQASWPEGRFSTIAGFVEPGESLEDALRREVREETNVEVADARYLGSQPWPFPSGIMIGFHADATTTNIVCNDSELAEARWVTRQEIAHGAVTLPPALSIAYRLIETWYDEHDGPTLASLGLPEVPLRVPRPLDES